MRLAIDSGPTLPIGHGWRIIADRVIRAKLGTLATELKCHATSFYGLHREAPSLLFKDPDP
jgi:hypothetical protein